MAGPLEIRRPDVRILQLGRAADAYLWGRRHRDWPGDIEGKVQRPGHPGSIPRDPGLREAGWTLAVGQHSAQSYRPYRPYRRTAP
jgi:hypothetical protein